MYIKKLSLILYDNSFRYISNNKLLLIYIFI